MIFSNQEAIELAISEIHDQEIELTKDFLAIHKIKYIDNKPSIARIDDTKKEKGVFFIYFSLEGEPYFYVVVIRAKDHQLYVSASYVAAKVRVYLSIKSRALSIEQINKIVGLKSTTTKNRPWAKFSHWRFEPQKDLPDELERKLDYLLDCLQPFKDNIAKLSHKSHITIQIAYQGYKESMWGWGLTRRQIRKITELRCEIDFDLYASGDSLPESNI